MKMIFHYVTKYTNEDISHSFQYEKIFYCVTKHTELG